MRWRTRGNNLNSKLTIMRNFIFLILAVICLSFSLSLPAVGQSSEAETETDTGIGGLYIDGSRDSGGFGAYFGGGSNTAGISFGIDVSLEGVLKNYTGPENALNNTSEDSISASFNVLLGGYALVDQVKPLSFVFSGVNVMALAGQIDTEIRCPAGEEYSSEGSKCAGDVIPETETKNNFGVLTTFHAKYFPLVFGIRYTTHSTGIVFGIGGLKPVN